MVIEHTFVTTLTAEKAMGLASSFLAGRGFVAKTQSAFQIDSTEWNHLEMSRGKSGTLDPEKCLQNVHLEFDRGRVTVAAQINPTIGRRTSAQLNPKSKNDRKYAQLMVALAQALDDLVAKQLPPDEAVRPWSELETAIFGKYRHQQKIGRIVSYVILAGVIGAACYIIWLITSNH